MEARRKRIIRSGAQYDHLFPKAGVDTHTVLKNAGVSDTVAFIPQVVSKTLGHTKGISGVLKGRNDYETCRNIWHFVYNHIAYRKDRDGYEQIRSPARTWHDRKQGVDCDCYSTLISSMLTNLGIRHKLRITKYRRDYFQHIYPIAELPGRQVAIDCVTDRFDYEVPYSEKKDYEMDLQYLNGLDDIGDADFEGYDEMGNLGELGRLFKKKSGKKGGGLFKKIGKGLKKINLKKVLNVVNKLNPATVAMRNGVLAAMKLNVGNVAKRLRWSYMTPEQAKTKGMRMDRWQKLVKARQKIEDIFYGAGGKTSNLKKAILQGKGNRDKAVHGFDGIDGFGSIYPYTSNHMYAAHRLHPMHPHHPINRIHRHMPLRQVLGDDIFFSENTSGSLGELGEPASMTMIAAASGVIAAIAGALKKIGDVFGGKGEGSKDFDEQTNADAEKDIPASSDKGGPDATAAAAIENDTPVPSSSGSGDDGGAQGSGQSKLPASPGSSGGAGDGSDGGGASPPAKQDGGDGGKDGGGEDGKPKDGFWDKNKKWIIPTGIGVAGITILAIAAKSMKPHTPAPASHGKPMHGVPNKHHHRKAKHGKKIKAKALV